MTLQRKPAKQIAGKIIRMLKKERADYNYMKKLQLISGHEVRKSLEIYQNLSLVDVVVPIRV